jgi:hypothetical protein
MNHSTFAENRKCGTVHRPYMVNPKPFAALPRFIADDPGIHPTDKAILLALAGFAWGKKSLCWPSNRTLAARVGRTPEHVQRRLVALEAAGLILREPCDTNRTGRTIRLLWRCPSPAPALSLSPRPALPKEDVIVKETQEPENPRTDPVQRSRPELELESASPAPPEPPVVPALVPELPAPTPSSVAAAPRPASRAEVSAPVTVAAVVPAVPPLPVELGPLQRARYDALFTSDQENVRGMLSSGVPMLVREALAKLQPPGARPAAPETTRELLERLQDDPTFPAAAAGALAREFDDLKSWAGYLARCREVYEGRRPPGSLVAAYAQATGPKAKNPGAIFMHAAGQTQG